ncbi:arginase [Rummeliibacillus suwonensis]|uniref:arginase n=1 Tax=Rummeliibacillus suwonensis TaxID=1306154 RepID=UPI0028987A6D|nr:arginase [Rummeliibacillus suwonensis]
MGNNLLSIDWDYFISLDNKNCVSTIENKKTVNDLWYKRYFQFKSEGKDLQKRYQLSEEADKFWGKMKKIFEFDSHVHIFVSDSHALSYKIAQMYNCDNVYLFDAHSDLGYGGLPSLEFELNCANWLGKLLKNKKVKEAHIIYGPYTAEKPENFQQMNELYHIEYPTINDLDEKTKISAIHICRSGAWTPPWLDGKFIEFIRKIGFSYTMTECLKRNWDPTALTYADQLQYLMT